MEYQKVFLPFAAMIVVEIGDVCMAVLGKEAMEKGLSPLAYASYSNTLGTCILSLWFLFNYRHKEASLSLSLLRKLFLLGLLGMCLAQIFATTGIRYSSPTLASALGNLLPGVTFLLAVIFRMEKVSLRSRSSQAKILGTMISISGALVVTLYKGPPMSSYLNSPSSTIPSSLSSLSQASNWVLGALLLSVSCLIASLWNILQTTVAKECPDTLTIVFFSSFFGAIQCVLMSSFLERDAAAWTLHPGIEMFAVLYAGAFGGAFRIFIMTWCIEKKGPLFVTSFKPLGTAIAVVMEITFLAKTPHVGSLIGASVIALGFYTVMLGKAKERDMAVENISSLDTSDQRTPLLSNV